MKTKETTTAVMETDDLEPLSADELLRNLLQDMLADASPDAIAQEFIDEFVLKPREETPQILAMFDTPTEQLIPILKGAVGQVYQLQLDALDSRGAPFLDELKSEVKTRMLALAEARGS